MSFVVNGYKYTTDHKGRLVSAEGNLRISDSEYKRHMEAVKKYKEQDYKADDQRGHLIAHIFGGSDRLENLVPMNARLNQSDYKKVENTLLAALEDKANVYVSIEPVYESDSNRPAEFRFTYIIDGEKNVVVFQNEKEQIK